MKSSPISVDEIVVCKIRAGDGINLGDLEIYPALRAAMYAIGQPEQILTRQFNSQQLWW